MYPHVSKLLTFQIRLEDSETVRRTTLNYGYNSNVVASQRLGCFPSHNIGTDPSLLCAVIIQHPLSPEVSGMNGCEGFLLYKSTVFLFLVLQHVYLPFI